MITQELNIWWKVGKEGDYMKKDTLRVFILEISLIVFLFFALFALNIFNRKILALVIGIYAIFVSYFFT